MDFIFWLAIINNIFSIFGFTGVLNQQKELVTGFFAYNAVQMIVAFHYFVDVCADVGIRRGSLVLQCGSSHVLSPGHKSCCTSGSQPTLCTALWLLAAPALSREFCCLTAGTLANQQALRLLSGQQQVCRCIFVIWTMLCVCITSELQMLMTIASIHMHGKWAAPMLAACLNLPRCRLCDCP